MYRITRTIIRGQFANDSCFSIWLAAQAGSVSFIKTVDDPLNTGGPNDKRYWLWNQRAEVTTPKCPNSDPDLVTRAGKNGWETEAEAQAVLDFEVGQSSVIAKNVADANARAVSAGNIATSIASDAEAAAKEAGKAISSGGPWVVVGLVALAALAWKVLK